jgi:hypothetical protein
MANSTTFLPPAAYGHLESKPILAEALIDFSKEPTVSGGTLDVLHIPKGAVVMRAGLIVHTTEATVTLEVGDSTDADEFLTAQTLTDLKANNNAGTADGGVISVDAAQRFYGAADTLRLTVGGATADTAIVTAFVEYYVIAKSKA